MRLSSAALLIFLSGVVTGQPTKPEIIRLIERGWDIPDAEASRTVDLLLPLFGQEGQPTELLDLRYLMGGDDLSRLLLTFPRPPRSLSAKEILAQCHRQMRADHIPLLAALAQRKDDPELVEEARATILFLASYTDRFRDDVVIAALGPEGTTKSPAAPGSALPSGLARVLRAYYLKPSDAEQSRTGSPSDGWLMRWLTQVEPRAGDAPLLLEVGKVCARHGWSYDLAVVIDRLGWTNDSGVAAWLATLDAEALNVAPAVLAAQARLSHLGAADALRARARRDATALANLFALDPGQARSSVLSALSKGSVSAVVDLLVKARFEALRYGLPEVDIDADGVLSATRSSPEAVALTKLGHSVPGCRTRRLAHRALELFRRGSSGFINLPDEAHAFLESAASPAWRALMRQELRHAAPEDAKRATSLLLRVADPVIVEHVVELLDDGADLGSDLYDLAARGDTVLVAALRRRAEKHGSAAKTCAVSLAVAAGLPPTAGSCLRNLLSDRSSFTNFQALVLEEAPEAVIQGILALFPDERIHDISRARRPEVKKYLQRLRSRYPAGGTYAWATGELARMGDSDALRELISVLGNGRKEWVDKAEPSHLTLNDDPTLVRLQISRLESQCCLISSSGAGDLFAERWNLEPFSYQDARPTPWRVVDRAFRRWRGQFVRSPILRSYIPEPAQ